MISSWNREPLFLPAVLIVGLSIIVSSGRVSEAQVRDSLVLRGFINSGASVVQKALDVDGSTPGLSPTAQINVVHSSGVVLRIQSVAGAETGAPRLIDSRGGAIHYDVIVAGKPLQIPPGEYAELRFGAQEARNGLHPRLSFRAPAVSADETIPVLHLTDQLKVIVMLD
jgi:hypothetical protein